MDCQRTIRSGKVIAIPESGNVTHAPWQKVMFNGAVAETVRHLISGTAIAMRNA